MIEYFPGPSSEEHEPIHPTEQEQYSYGHGEYTPAESSKESSEDIDPIERILTGVEPGMLDEEKLKDLVDSHPVILSKLTTLKELRSKGFLTHEREQSFIDDLKATRNDISNEFKDRLGIPRVDETTMARKAEAERLRGLADILSSLEGNESDDELLAKYRLVDEDGRMTEATMKSPLFKADTSKAFEKYMRYAVNFEAMEQFEAMQGTHLRNTQAASNMRGEAHDIVAALVARDLGLPFEASRRFVAKAREARVPGLQEKMVYSIATQRFAEKLLQENGNDATVITGEMKDSLEEIISTPMDHEEKSD